MAIDDATLARRGRIVLSVLALVMFLLAIWAWFQPWLFPDHALIGCSLASCVLIVLAGLAPDRVVILLLGPWA